MYVYMHIHVCVYIHTAHIQTCICTYIHTYIQVSMYIYIHAYIHTVHIVSYDTRKDGVAYYIRENEVIYDTRKSCNTSIDVCMHTRIESASNILYWQNKKAI